MEVIMRRRERECSDPSFFRDLLERAAVVTLAFPAGEYPYVIPVNFVFMNGSLYFHSAPEGRKLDCLKQVPRVGFSVHELIDIDREKSTTLYRCLYGEGQASPVVDNDEKRKALAALAGKYQSRCSLPVPDAALKRTAVIRIDIISMSGKRNLPAPAE